MRLSLFAGEVITHESVKCVMGEGMPTYKNPFEKGRLIIQFQVNFPDKITTQDVIALEQILPPR